MKFVKCEKCPLFKDWGKIGHEYRCALKTPIFKIGTFPYDEKNPNITVSKEEIFVAQIHKCQLYSINIGGGIFEPHNDSNLIE